MFSGCLMPPALHRRQQKKYFLRLMRVPHTNRPNKSPEPTAVGAVSSAVAVHVTSRRWLSFFVRPFDTRMKIQRAPLTAALKEALPDFLTRVTEYLELEEGGFTVKDIRYTSFYTVDDSVGFVIFDYTTD